MKISKVPYQGEKVITNNLFDLLQHLRKTQIEKKEVSLA